MKASTRTLLIVPLLSTSLFGQANAGVVKIETERTLLNKATDAVPKIVQRQTYYLAADGRQRHETTQVANGRTSVEITLWAEHKKIMLDLQTKRADVLLKGTPAMTPSGRMGRMVVPQSQTDLGTRIVHGLTLHGALFMMPYPQGTMRSEVWDYRGEVQSPNFPPVIVETVWDDPMSMEEERVVDVSNVQVPASMFEVPVDFVQTNGIGDRAGKGLPVKAIEARLLDQLAAAEAKWAVNKPKAYEFGINFRLGSVVRLTRPGLEWPVFHVEDGTASLVSGDPGLGTAGDTYNTVDKQFSFIGSKLAKQPYRVEIEYDSIYGYPKHVYMKMFAQAVDDEYGFDVTGFTVVGR
jgi:Family of unknown function (DUF6174)